MGIFDEEMTEIDTKPSTGKSATWSAGMRPGWTNTQNIRSSAGTRVHVSTLWGEKMDQEIGMEWKGVVPKVEEA